MLYITSTYSIKAYIGMKLTEFCSVTRLREMIVSKCIKCTSGTQSLSINSGEVPVAVKHVVLKYM